MCVYRCWSALKGGLSADEIAAAHDVLLERMDAEFETLKRLEAVSSAAEATFAGAASAKEMDPAATTDARSTEAEAAENAQARPKPLCLSQSVGRCLRSCLLTGAQAAEATRL